MKSNPLWHQPSVGDNSFLSNPFATRFVRPGCLAWISPSHTSVANLAAKFKTQHGCQAAIVGPHGSGKSTLLSHLVPELGDVAWHQPADKQDGLLNPTGNIVWLALRRAGQRPLPQIVATRKYWRQGGLLVLDGLEQLRPWEVLCLRITQRAAGMGLLATCHRRLRMPGLNLATLVDTHADAELVRRLIVERLESACGISSAWKQDFTQIQLIERLLEEEQGNVREVFMRLYDLVEIRRVQGRFSNPHNASAIKISNMVARS